MKKIETQYKTRVEFYDLDPMNVVWHGNYVKYLEAARCDFLEKIGCTYDDIKEAGYAYPVAKMEMKFVTPCVFMQNLVVKTQLESLEPSLNFKYTILDEKTGAKLSSAKTMQICVEIETRKTVYSVPDVLKKRVENYES